MKYSFFNTCLFSAISLCLLSLASPVWAAQEGITYINANKTYSNAQFIYSNATATSFTNPGTTLANVMVYQSSGTSTFNGNTSISVMAPGISSAVYGFSQTDNTCSSTFNKDLNIAINTGDQTGSIYGIRMGATNVDGGTSTVKGNLNINTVGGQGGSFVYLNNGSQLNVNGNVTLSGNSSQNASQGTAGIVLNNSTMTIGGALVITSDGLTTGSDNYLNTTGLNYAIRATNNSTITLKSDAVIRAMTTAVSATRSTVYLSGGEFINAGSPQANSNNYALHASGGSVITDYNNTAHQYILYNGGIYYGSVPSMSYDAIYANSSTVNLSMTAGSSIISETGNAIVVYNATGNVTLTTQTTEMRGNLLCDNGTISLSNKNGTITSGVINATQSSAGSDRTSINITNQSGTTTSITGKDGQAIVATGYYDRSAFITLSDDATSRTIITGDIIASVANSTIDLSGINATSVTGNLNAYNTGIIKLTMRNQGILTGQSSINNFGANGTGTANLTLQDSSTWNITGDSSLTTLTAASGTSLVFGGANTKDSFTDLTLNDVSLADGTNVTFLLGSTDGITAGTEFQIITAASSYSINANKINFTLTKSFWKDGQHYAIDWDTNSFNTGLLKVKGLRRIPEPATAVLSLLGLSTLLMRRRRV